MKNRGFFLLETLIVTSVVAVAMVALYSQVTLILNSYEKRAIYNDANSMYAMVEVNDYIVRDTKYTTFTGSASIPVNGFVNITCDMFSSPQYCQNMYESLGIEKLIISLYNTDVIKTKAPTEATFDADMKEFIDNIKRTSYAPATDYRIIAQFVDGSFGTMKLDKGNDTVIPTITYKSGYNATIYFISGEIVDPKEGLIGTDNLLGDVTDNIVCTGTIPSFSCTVKDSSGNVSATISRTVTVLTSPWNYSYTGAQQIFTTPVSGMYQIELWGAQGGTRYATYQIGGLGAYAKADIYLTAGQAVYIYVGNQGTGSSGASQSAGGFNGGGNGGAGSSGQGGSGGGATDIRIGGIAATNRYLVAGGGGGASGYNSTTYTSHGGYGGGTAVAGSGTYTTVNQNGTGATYTAFGTVCTDNVLGTPTSGSFSGSGGIGGSNTTYGGGGGGGGYYGGGGGCHTYGSGGGGSSYFNTSLANISLIAGNAVMPNPAGGTMTGRTGTGYARITFLSR